MTRVHIARPQHVPQHSIALDQTRAVVRKKKPYKIVLEAVTQEKKKLHSILTYASNAPKGFGFIPAGNPEVTEWCKEQCRQRNLDVHIVSAKPKNKMHADPEKLSHHVHRVGHHFPLEIVNLACSKFGYTYDEANGLRKDKSRDRTNWIAQRVEDYSSRQQTHGRPTTEKESKEHTRGAVREMFPKIPEADLTSIVNHAFEEGTNRVGNAKELTLARRVQLAVVAHIRHMYTDYDKLLKTGSWMQARQNVEHVSLAKLKEWRDEAGEQSNEIEDTFREVIVLDDEDESSDEDSFSTPDEREQSMEIVSSRATARDLQPERYADHSRMDVHTMRRVPRRTIVVKPYPVSHSAPLSSPLHRQPMPQPVLGHSQTYLSSRPPSREALKMAHSRQSDPRVRLPTAHPPPRGTQPLMQKIDGQLYHVSVNTFEPFERDIKLEPIRESHDLHRNQHDSTLRAAPRFAQNGYVQTPPKSSSFDQPSAHSRRPSDQDVVLPSVERETVDLTSPRRVVNGHHTQSDAYPPSKGYDAPHSPKRKAFVSFPDGRDEYIGQDPKRPRPMYYEDGLSSRAGHMQVPRPVLSNSHQPMDTRGQPRAQAQQTYIDLTSSPRRPPIHGDSGYSAPMYAHTAAGSSGLSYVPVASRRSPVREVRGALYEAHSGEPPRAYIPNSGMYERRAAPVRDYIPLRDDQHRRPVQGEGSRYLGSGLHYGGPGLH